MSSCTDPFDESFQHLSNDEKLPVYRTWLDNNKSHPFRHFVKHAMELEQLLKIKEQAKKIEEQAKKIEEQAEKKEEQAKIIEQRSLKTLLKGYPMLTDRTMSGFYWPENAPHAEVMQTDICDPLLEEVEKSFMSDDYWNAPYLVPNSDNCDHEDDCKNAVKALLESSIKGLQLDKIIEVLQKRTLAGAECDLLLVYKPNQLPFAALEIKKAPNKQEDRDHLFHGKISKGDSTKKENKVAGEVWAELNGVRLFGFDKVYGMISTSNQFRLVYTGDKDSELENVEAMLNSLNSLKTRNNEKRNNKEETSNQIVTSPEGKSVPAIPNKNGVDQEKASLYASQIIPQSHNDDNDMRRAVKNSRRKIMRLVTLFILKACTTLTRLLDSNGPSKAVHVYKKMPCRILSKDENQFAFGTVSLTTLNLDAFIPHDAKSIYVIHHLGMGNSGNCCLGVSGTGGSSCAIKFYHSAGSKQTTELANKEFENWNHIYGKCKHEKRQYGLPMAFQLELVEGCCLVMPYLRPIPKSNRHTLLEKGRGGDMSRIEETLRKFTDSGYKHEDIKWRHFGCWKNEYFLLDLEKVTKVKQNEIDSWVEETLEKLRKNAGETPRWQRKRGRPTEEGQPKGSANAVSTLDN